ncbi:MAG: YbhB/YbcL family Raf kinase inhibitor-like protein [Burkholderiaceae bacterium]|nr:YbhB/YbcL family Raf kinase inhibitor-like protein [Burkholderiaceae bacterium]MBP6815642.1 YbhB/YbcL family Raf kinase inhibitor-like protein [Burkholderiaceae bacterium]MBP7659797.1 YbhB/YbcL family Raf kinase inhibitor-like protein [Burkholderiaceae bacterium]
MKVWSDSFADGATIPVEFAFGRIDAATRVALSGNRNPHLAWSGLPVGTKSLAVVCHDPDVPSSGEDVNQEGREVPASLARVSFHHWILVDLPASRPPIAAGEYSSAVTPRGKPGPSAGRGARQGINDYTGWFANDPDMAGDYFGYDGPCPPWNDSLLHRYVFTVYALDVDVLPLMGRFNGADALKVIERHTLGKASISGTYSLNPRLAAA